MTYRGRSPLDRQLQGFQATSLDGNIGFWQAAGSGTTVNVLGFGNSATGTATARTPNGVSLPLSAVRRVAYVSAVAVGSSAGTRFNASTVWRGSSLGQGGFEYEAVFGLPVFAADSRVFVGLRNLTSAIANVDPSTLVNIIGFGADSGDANWQLMRNDAAGTATKVDLGGAFSKVNVAALYRLRISCEPNAASVLCQLESLNTANKANIEVTTDLPSSGTFLGPHMWVNNAGSVPAVWIDVSQQRLGSRF